MAETSSTGGQKRAVLLGCPVGSLKGIEKDLQTMECLLDKYGFISTKCFPATRADIIAAWNKIIDQTKPEDAVVIYYSGHGGLTERSGEGGNANRPLRLQYLIPFDFEETREGDWRGITDMELSRLLRMTTNRTENVTIILDCCHSARMARRQGAVKAIDPGDYREIIKHVEKMMDQGDFGTHFHHERNPLAICIAAAAETEYAYEQDFRSDNEETRMSVLTEALAKALQLETQQDAQPCKISWRSIMLSIRDRMKITCPQQYPQVEGDDLRFAFSLEKADLFGAISISQSTDGAILQGGMLHGLNEGDVYAVLPFGEESIDPSKQIAEVMVTEVGPTVSMARFEGASAPVLGDGAKAFPTKRALGQFPVAVRGPEEFKENFRTFLKTAKFLRVADGSDKDLLATVIREASGLILQSHEGNISFLLAEWHLQNDQNLGSEITECIARIESLARSRHVLTLEGELGPDAISEQAHVELGLIKNGLCEPFSGNILVISEHERFYLKIRNTGTTTIYASIFDVCAESVTLLSTGRPAGRELPPGQTYTYGELNLKRQLVGSRVSWPEKTPKKGDIPEAIIVLIADDRIDNLRGLETGWKYTQRSSGSRVLSELINDLATRRLRTVAPESEQTKYLRYGLRRFFFQLRPALLPTEGPPVGSAGTSIQTQNQSLTLGRERPSQQPTQDEEYEDLKQPPIPAAQLPSPETVMQGSDNVSGQTGKKGLIRMMVRTVRGVPSSIRVVNQHIEEITVVVSKYRPNLMLTGGGINASATGAGLDFSTTTFLSPATKKTLAPQSGDPERAGATFPLWTRMDGFGVISIFTGPEKVLYIENDKVPLGATVYFTNKPDLTIVRYDSHAK